MNTKTILFIGLVWPEPVSSAAGTRIVQLIRVFLEHDFRVIFASAASKSEFSAGLEELGVTERAIRLNDSSFNTFLGEIRPDIVLFDRFVTEEQYGWRVQQECPDAMRILDTEDLHFLRHARQDSVRSGQDTVLFSDMAKRELASIYRCDLSLIISEKEMLLLQEQFRTDPSLLYYLPFLEEELSAEVTGSWKSFDEREGFVFIGNFLHEPNWHTLQQLKTSIWPLLRKQSGDAGLHIYGAYPSQKVQQLHNEKERFYVHGRAADAKEAISRHRVMLAPILFGAGLKGKFIDAMQTGTPSVTTAMGAEAMQGGLSWNGAIADEPEAFAAAAAALYKDRNLWQEAQQNGISLINTRYNKERFAEDFFNTILKMDLKTHREHNFFGQILQHHTLSSAKYLSLWIEEKNKT